jgi:FtsZ-binding cell division protein ZapB
VQSPGTLLVLSWYSSDDNRLIFLRWPRFFVLSSFRQINEEASVAVVKALFDRRVLFDCKTAHGNYWICAAYDLTNPFEKSILAGDTNLDISKLLFDRSCDTSELLGIEIDGITILDMIVGLEIDEHDSVVYTDTIQWLLMEVDDVKITTKSIQYGSVGEIQDALDDKNAQTQRFLQQRAAAEQR